MYFNGTKCYALVFCCFLSLSLAAKEAKTKQQVQGLHKPLCFVENKGQVIDQDNNPRTDIQYQLSTPGMNLFVGDAQLHYQFKKLQSATGISQTSMYRVDVALLGANKNATVTGTDKQAYYENYFLPWVSSDGLTVHSWNRITYKDVYPNIDWVLYVKENKVEYDFVVHPGGNVADIRLQYDGATKLNVTSDGSIVAGSLMGTISEKTPYSYEMQTGKAIASAFELHDNIISFKTGDYNGTLVIDPAVLWSTYFGGSNEDVVTGIRENAGNTYVAGRTNSNLIATGGAFLTSRAGGFDAFVAKYNNLGVLQFSTYYGATGDDKATCIALDNAGSPNIYIAGSTTSNIPTLPGIPSGGAFQTTYGGGTADGFIVRLNNAGNARSWGTFYGGTANDHINGIACDPSNSVYVIGQTSSTAGIASAGAYQTALSGTTDAFIAKFNSTGTRQWGTYYGGPGQEEGFAIATDASGNLVVTGITNSLTTMSTAGAYQAALAGSSDAFMAKFSTSGARAWATYFGGAASDQGNAVVINQTSGDIAIAGNTSSSTGIATTNGYQTVFGGGAQDAFLAYFTSAGAIKWGSYYGGSSLDYGQAVSLDVSGNVVIAGGTFSTNGISSPGAVQASIGGDYDAFIAKFNAGFGQRLWGTYFGGTLYDFANAVACDLTNDQVAIGGYTTSLGSYGAGGISTTGVTQPSNAGGTYDGFITKFAKDVLALIAQPYIDTLVCPGGTLVVSYTTTAAFNAGNVFTIQLSDAAGSFAAPVNIGTISATGSGTVSTVIPSTTPLGTGYRIRITASNPAYTSPDNYINIQVVSAMPPTVASGTTPVCVGSTISLTDVASYPVASFSWTGPAGSGFSSALQNPTIIGATLANSGTYTVAATHNGCPPNISTVNIVVNNIIPPTPTASVTASALYCANTPLHLFANPDTTATGITYHWSGPAGSGFTSTAQNPVIAAPTTSNSGYYVVVDTLAGCPSLRDSVYVSITANNPVSITIRSSPGDPNNGPGDTICQGTLVTFVASSTTGGLTPAYQWMSGPAAPIVGAISNTFSSPSLINGETIYCVLTSSLICPFPVNAPSNTITMNVINNSPIVNITANAGAFVSPTATVIFTSNVFNGGIAPLYQWKLNGVNIPGAIFDTLTLHGVTATDSITLMVTSTMNCAVPDSAISNTIVIQPNTAVAKVSPLDDIALFPNPTNGTFTIRGSMEGIRSGSVTYEVVNAMGQLVTRGDALLQNTRLDKTISLENTPAGIYLVRITGDGQGKTFRIVVQLH
jgi:hypothetical protein